MRILTTEDKMLMLISATRTSVFLKISAVSKILSLKSGSTHAFKWDWKGKVDESKGILLPMRGLLLFSEANEHPKVDLGCQKTGRAPKKMSTRRWILEPKMSGFGPQMGIACAFKSDLKGKVDESKGTLLPMHGILLFSKENVHPRVDLGAQSRGSGTKAPRPYLRFPREKVRFLEF